VLPKPSWPISRADQRRAPQNPLLAEEFWKKTLPLEFSELFHMSFPLAYLPYY
jgi:hypothetical protein